MSSDNLTSLQVTRAALIIDGDYLAAATRGCTAPTPPAGFLPAIEDHFKVQLQVKTNFVTRDPSSDAILLNHKAAVATALKRVGIKTVDVPQGEGVSAGEAMTAALTTKAMHIAWKMHDVKTLIFIAYNRSALENMLEVLQDEGVYNTYFVLLGEQVQLSPELQPYISPPVHAPAQGMLRLTHDKLFGQAFTAISIAEEAKASAPVAVAPAQPAQTTQPAQTAAQPKPAETKPAETAATSAPAAAAASQPAASFNEEPQITCPLPAGCSMHFDKNYRRHYFVYVKDGKQLTEWTHPSGKEAQAALETQVLKWYKEQEAKKAAAPSTSPKPPQLSTTAAPWTPGGVGAKNESALPSGWEQKTDPHGRVYYLDHNTKSTSWERPK